MRIKKYPTAMHDKTLRRFFYSTVIQLKQVCGFFSCMDCCVEDEYHFIFVFPVYAIYSKKYIIENKNKKPSMLKQFHLFNAESYRILLDLGKLILNIMNLRSVYITA